MVTARLCALRELVEDPPGDARLHERILELVPVAQEPAVEDERVGGHLEEVFGAETAGVVQHLALREELRRPVDGTAEASCRVVALGTGRGCSGREGSERQEFLRVGPSAFCLEE